MSTTATTATPDTDDVPATGYGFRTAVTATADTHPMIMATTDGPNGPTDPPTDVAETEFAAYANEVRTFLARFWHAPSEASLDFLTLWIIGTHLRGRNADPFLPESYPLLMLGSTEPESGKTTALKMVATLAARGKMDAAMTAPSALNAVEGTKATLCFDEFDTLIGNGAGSRDLRAHLLASYDTGGSISKAAGKGETRDVDVHFPIAFAGLIRTFATHKQLAALRTRTIVLHCRPAPSGPDAPKLERYRTNKHRPLAVALREVLSAWGLAVAPIVAHVAESIVLPDGVHNRDAQLWEPIFALAQSLGGDWTARCLAACLEITRGQAGEDAMPTTAADWLLRDLGTVVTPDRPRISTADMVTGLLAVPGATWDQWLISEPRNPIVSAGKQMARILADRNGADGEPLKPRVLKIDKVPVRGFERADLLAAGMPDVRPDPTDDADDAPKPAKRTRTRPAPKPAHGRPATPVTSV